MDKYLKLSLFLFLNICISFCAEYSINELPMYGGKHSPTVDRNVKFSIDAAKLGWKYYHSGDLKTAIKRFNQAWMFNRKNVDAFWGFGLIMGRRASKENPRINLKESIKYLKIAFELDNTNGRVLGDLAFSHTLLGEFLNSKKEDSTQEFQNATQLFKKAYSLNPKYPPIIANWSVLYFYMGDYKKAKSKSDIAIKLGYKFSRAYLKDLKKKLKK